MRIFLLIAFVVMMLLLQPGSVTAGKTDRDFSQGERSARLGDIDGAFMYFRSVILKDEKGPVYERALFAVGEYYYLEGIYTQATKTLTRFIKEYPRSEGRIFALAYLMKIAEFQQHDSLVKILRHQIVTFQQVSLLFRDSKEFEYLSSLQRTLKVVYYIDKVEFYANEELLTRIPY